MVRAPLTALAALLLPLALALAALAPFPIHAADDDTSPTCTAQCEDADLSGRFIDRIRCVCECDEKTADEEDICGWAFEVCTDVLEEEGRPEGGAYGRCSELIWPDDPERDRSA